MEVIQPLAYPQQGNRGNKNAKTCYPCGKPGQLASVGDTHEETDNDDSDTSSDDEHYLPIESKEMFAEAVRGKYFPDISKVRFIDAKPAHEQLPLAGDEQTRIVARSSTPYPEQWARWDEEINAITEMLDKPLGSNASEGEVIPKLQRQDATISDQHARISHMFCFNNECKVHEKRKHASLSWTACYEDHCAIHQSSKADAGWYPREPRRRAVEKRWQLNLGKESN